MIIVLLVLNGSMMARIMHPDFTEHKDELLAFYLNMTRG